MKRASVYILLILIWTGGVVAALPRSPVCFAIGDRDRIEYVDRQMPAMPIVRWLNSGPADRSVYLVGTHMYRYHLNLDWQGESSGGYIPGDWEYQFWTGDCEYLFIREIDGLEGPEGLSLLMEQGDYKLYERISE